MLLSRVGFAFGAVAVVRHRFSGCRRWAAASAVCRRYEKSHSLVSLRVVYTSTLSHRVSRQQRKLLTFVPFSWCWPC